MRVRQTIGLGLLAAAAFALGHHHAGTPTVLAQEEPFVPPMSEERMIAMMEAGQPGPHHRRLDALVGTWDGSMRIWMEPDRPPVEIQGTITRRWVLDGHYLEEAVTSETPGGPFRGLGYIGYDNVDGQYQMVWMDSSMTGIMFETGYFDPDAKVMHMSGRHRDPVSGRLIPSWGELDMSNPERHVMRAQAVHDGRRMTTFESVVERRVD